MSRGLQAALAMFLVALLAIGLAAPGPFGGGPISVTPGSRLTTLELGHPTDTTLGRGAAGHLTVEGKRVWRDGDTQALSDGANIAWDVGAGRIGTVTIAGNRTLDNPTGLATGGEYTLVLLQDATAQRTLAFGSTFEPCQIRRSASASTVCRWVYDGAKLRVIAQPSARLVAFAAETSATITNIAASTTEFNGGVGRRRYADFTGVQEVRLQVNVNAAASAGDTMGVQYSLNGGTDWFGFDGAAAGDLGSIEPQVSIASGTVTVASSWAAIPAAARAEVLLRVVTDNGDGAADPTFPGIVLDYR